MQEENTTTPLQTNEFIEKRRTDTYLECLVFLTKFHNKTVSKDSLVYGLKGNNDVLNLKSFLKSSSRIGLISKIQTRKLEEISQLSLPALLILNDNRSCILLELDFENNKAKVILPGFDGETILSIDKVREEYTNSIVFVKNDYQFKNKLHADINIDNPKNWFFGALKKNKPIYVKVALAAIFINLFVIATPMFTMNVYDRVLPNNAIETLWVLAIGIFIVMVFDFILKMIRSTYLGLANKKADIIMSNKIFEHLLNIRIEEKPSSTGMFLS